MCHKTLISGKEVKEILKKLKTDKAKKVYKFTIISKGDSFCRDQYRYKA